jgi:hypothetical protein
MPLIQAHFAGLFFAQNFMRYNNLVEKQQISNSGKTRKASNDKLEAFSCTRNQTHFEPITERYAENRRFTQV